MSIKKQLKAIGANECTQISGGHIGDGDGPDWGTREEMDAAHKRNEQRFQEMIDAIVDIFI